MPLMDLSQVRDALVAVGVTGPHQSHSRQSSISKIHTLLEEDSEETFGLSGVTKYSAAEILSFVAKLTGCSPDIANLEGHDTIDPNRTIDGIVRAAERLRDGARQGATLLTVTGHPSGLLEHHIRVVDAFRRAGGKALSLRENENISSRRGRHEEVRYVGGVGCLADWGSLRHTHSAAPMEALLEAGPWPDLVLGDHGFAGAAIERDIATVAVMDVNDPALAIAWAESGGAGGVADGTAPPSAERPPGGGPISVGERPPGGTEGEDVEAGELARRPKRDVLIVPMDDNRTPRSYEPSWRLFRAIIEEGV